MQDCAVYAIVNPNNTIKRGGCLAVYDGVRQHRIIQGNIPKHNSISRLKGMLLLVNLAVCFAKKKIFAMLWKTHGLVFDSVLLSQEGWGGKNDQNETAV